MSKRARVSTLAVAAAVLWIPLVSAPAMARPGPPSSPAAERSVSREHDVALWRLVVPDAAGVERIVQRGVDLAEYRRQVPGGVEVHAVLTRGQAHRLQREGIRLLGTLADAQTVAAVQRERRRAVADDLVGAADAAEPDRLSILRAEWFVSVGLQRYVSIEVKTTAGDDAQTILTARWQDQSVTMERFTDSGVYLYHRLEFPVPVDAVPRSVMVTSTRGGTVSAPLEQWLGDGRRRPRPHYVRDFVDHYMDPTESYARIEKLAAEFDGLADIVELPYRTHGYRRKAKALFGDERAGLYVSSRSWGHEGGNRITVELRDPGAANAPLSITVAGAAVVVTLGTNGAGVVTSTAAEVVRALNADRSASQLLVAHTVRGTAGVQSVRPAAAARLTDGLAAPASISREPFTVRALRIGRHRDGSRTGVLAYSQEHAREWVTPLVVVEAAERLLRNYRTDDRTRQLVDDLDIFIIPSVNPDGGHYSFYDFNFQRKNLANYCGPEWGDPLARNLWGVDINRNFSVGSRLDGYEGASGDCTSALYSGRKELSEPEARNQVWLTRKFPNIAFAMNVHSYGGYFMWPPGAYRADGRVSLPRPSAGEEDYFWAASSRILTRVQEERGTAIWPGRTGPVVDVLYSAAGNSADEHWYSRGIFGWDFEVGADLWDPAAREWVAVGFQPPFAEGHGEAMEFANGLIGLFEVARGYGRDRTAPRSWITASPPEQSRRTIAFRTSEPATVYYTVDGTRPDYRSPRVELAGLREGPRSVTLTRTTRLKWFSVDVAANVENGYRPHGAGAGYRERVIPVS